MGAPIETMRTSPVHACDAGFPKPSLFATNVAVTSARTHGPSGRPVSQSIPDGRSRASTGAPEAFTAPTRSAAAPEIARAMQLSPKTVLNYCTLIRQKLGADNDFKLLHLAARHGLMTLQQPMTSTM